MDRVDRQSFAGQALPLLAQGLSPFVTKPLEQVVPSRMGWAELLCKKDAANGRDCGQYRSTEATSLLPAMTERLGDAPFTPNMLQQAGFTPKDFRKSATKCARI